LDLDEALANFMPYFPVFGRSRPEWPIYDDEAAPLDFISRQAIFAYPKSLFDIFINPAFHRFGKFRKIMADGFLSPSDQKLA